jgi:hypothetical protein
MSTDALREAAMTALLHFRRNATSGNWQGDDEHEAWSKLEAALAAPASETVEELAARLHNVYQEEAKRQGDPRHADSYDLLPERIKEFDRVLARYILQREAALKADRQGG